MISLSDVGDIGDWQTPQPSTMAGWSAA